MPRDIHYAYDDPLDLIWKRALTELGFRVERDEHVFAHWRVDGVLLVGNPEQLDADDTLAQLVLHELCHGLVEGPASWTLPDWGLENLPEKRVHEHACLRLQAALTQPFGLRTILASTTNFRTYYDQLPEEPLADCEVDPIAVAMARAGWERATMGEWSAPIEDALRKTAKLARLVSKSASPNSFWSQFDHSKEWPACPLGELTVARKPQP